MAKTLVGIVLVLVYFSSASAAADTSLDAEAAGGINLSLRPETGALLDSFPIPLPSYQIVPRSHDRSVFVAVEYLSELWMTSKGTGRLEVCVDVNPGGYCAVEARPLPKADPVSVFGIVFSDFFNQVAGFTQVGFSLAYSFKS